MSSLRLILLIILSQSAFIAYGDKDSDCDEIWNECELDCLSIDLRPDSCITCCDLVHSMCLESNSLEVTDEIFDKFNHCFDRNDTKFSNRLSHLHHERSDKSYYPNPKEDYTFEHGWFSLRDNVIILDRIDYIDCYDTDLSNEISQIKLDYNEYTFKIKIGSIIIMDKDQYLSLDETDHCQHAPAATVTDLDIIEDIENGNYLLLSVKRPLIFDYFEYFEANMPAQDIHPIEKKSDIIEKSSTKSITPSKHEKDIWEIKKSNGDVFTCWLIINGTYAIKKLDIRVCEHYFPLNSQLIALKAQNKSSYAHYSSNNNNMFTRNNLNSTEIRRRMFWKKIKKFANAVVGWIKNAAESIANAVTVSISRIKELASQVFEAIEEIGSSLDDLFDTINNGLAIVQFGDFLYEGISGVIKFIDNLLSGTILLKWPYGIWLDMEQVTAQETSGEKTIELVKDKLDLEFTASASLEITTNLIIKFGGQAVLEAKYGIAPPSIDKFLFYVEAGIGFDFLVDFAFSGELTAFLKSSYEKEYVFLLSFVPVIMDFEVNFEFGFTIQAAFEFSFHAGIGEYTKAYGIEFRNGKLDLYENGTNTLNPGMDFAYGMSEDNQQSCLNVDLIPSLKLGAGLKLYKSLGIAVEFPIEATITLDYPTDACGTNICANNEKQELGLTFNGLVIAADLVLSFSTKDDDLQTLLDLLGAEGIDSTHTIRLFEIDDLVPGGQSACTKFEFLPLLLLCCGDGYISNQTESDTGVDTTGFIDIEIDPIKSLPSYIVGDGDPIPNTIYHIVNQDNGIYQCMTWDDSNSEIILEDCDEDDINQYWVVRFTGENKYLEYKLINLNYYSDDANFYTLPYLYTTDYNNEGKLTLEPELIDSVEGWYWGGDNYTLEQGYIDDNGTSFHFIYWYNFINNESEYISVFDGIIKHSINKYGNNSLFSFIEVSTQIIPTEMTDHWIQPIYNQYSDLYLGLNDSKTDSIINVDENNGFNRWIIEKITHEVIYIYISPTNSDNILNNNYILCWDTEINLIRLREQYTIPNGNADLCKWFLIRYEDNDNIVSFNIATYYDRRPLYFGDYNGNLEYGLDEEKRASEFQTDSDVYKYQFVDVPNDYDLPTSDQLYRIQIKSNGDYLTCGNDNCDTLTLQGDFTSNIYHQMFNFISISDLQTNLFIISPALNTGCAIEFSRNRSNCTSEIYNGTYVKDKYKIKTSRYAYEDGKTFNWEFIHAFDTDNGYFLVTFQYNSGNQYVNLEVQDDDDEVPESRLWIIRETGETPYPTTTPTLAPFSPTTLSPTTNDTVTPTPTVSNGVTPEPTTSQSTPEPTTSNSQSQGELVVLTHPNFQQWWVAVSIENNACKDIQKVEIKDEVNYLTYQEMTFDNSGGYYTLNNNGNAFNTPLSVLVTNSNNETIEGIDIITSFTGDTSYDMGDNFCSGSNNSIMVTNGRNIQQWWLRIAIKYVICGGLPQIAIKDSLNYNDQWYDMNYETNQDPVDRVYYGEAYTLNNNGQAFVLPLSVKITNSNGTQEIIGQDVITSFTQFEEQTITQNFC